MSIATVLLRDLAHFQLLGPDAERYLNGQVTQKLTGLPLSETCYTFVCDAKGRILFDAHITRIDNGFLLNTALQKRDEVLPRLDRYLIADDCEWQDVTEDWVLIHQFEHDGEPQPGSLNRFGFPGRDQYFAIAEIERPPITDDCNALESTRIEQGVPRTWDLEGAFPAETGLEDRAVSFAKGCYLGQEVISRMKRAGRTNRKLIRALVTGPDQELPASFAPVDSDKPLFTLTSAVESPDGSPRAALGYLATRYDPSQALHSTNGCTVQIL